MTIITDVQEKNQAALEAIELLNDAGYLVGNSEIDSDSNNPYFKLELTLSLPREERPLA